MCAHPSDTLSETLTHITNCEFRLNFLTTVEESSHGHVSRWQHSCTHLRPVLERTLPVLLLFIVWVLVDSDVIKLTLLLCCLLCEVFKSDVFLLPLWNVTHIKAHDEWTRWACLFMNHLWLVSIQHQHCPTEHTHHILLPHSERKTLLCPRLVLCTADWGWKCLKAFAGKQVVVTSKLCSEWLCEGSLLKDRSWWTGCWPTLWTPGPGDRGTSLLWRMLSTRPWLREERTSHRVRCSWTVWIWWLFWGSASSLQWIWFTGLDLELLLNAVRQVFDIGIPSKPRCQGSIHGLMLLRLRITIIDWIQCRAFRTDHSVHSSWRFILPAAVCHPTWCTHHLVVHTLSRTFPVSFGSFGSKVCDSRTGITRHRPSYKGRQSLQRLRNHFARWAG